MKIKTENCQSCGQCEEVCPVGAIIPAESKGYSRYKIDELVCMDCGECLTVDCPGDCIIKQGD
jgi:ferredoxin